ncbi:MAG: leucine-rich repeat domain-containing protein [Prevotella sp.]|nr:leucine-rich repeat domain-containing protein [Prevotella sp.]
MKKSLLFLSLSIMALCLMPRVAWAGTPTVSLSNGVLTITSDEAGQLDVSQLTSEQKASCTQIVLSGKFNQSDLEKIQNSQGFTAVTTVDMSEAKFVTTGSAGASNYILYNANGKGNSGYDGARCVEGAQLWQLTSITSQWTAITDATEQSQATEVYFSDSEKDDYLYRYQDNDKIKIQPANYYAMKVTRSLAQTTTQPASGNLVTTNASESELTPANISNVGDYVKYETYDYYKYNISKAWVSKTKAHLETESPAPTVDMVTDKTESNYTTSTEYLGTENKWVKFPYDGNGPYYYQTYGKWEVVNLLPDGVTANTPNNITKAQIESNPTVNDGYNLGAYIQFTEGEGESATTTYYQRVKHWRKLTETPSSYNERYIYYTSEDIDADDTYDPENRYNNNEGTIIQVPETYHYYKCEWTRSWDDTVPDLYNSTLVGEKPSTFEGYNENQVVKVLNSTTYYQLEETRTWEGPYTSLPNGKELTATLTTENEQTEADKLESVKSTYNDGACVRFLDGTALYYKKTSTRNWTQQTYTNGESKTIKFEFANETDMNANTTALLNDYAIIGGTKYVGTGTAWETESGGTYDNYDYSQMKFTYWKETLTTAITSKYADNSITNGIFDGCKNLTSVDYKAGNVTGFQDHKTSEGYASGLQVTIGKNVTTINSSAFQRCDALTTLTFDKDYSNSNADKLPGITYPVEMTIEENAFQDCVNLTGVEFPNRVTKIGDTAFERAGNSTDEFTVTFERRRKVDDGNVSIDHDTNLTIGSGAFQECSKLKDLSLPIRLSSMGSNAFAYTSSLTKLEIREDVENARLKTIPSGAFLDSGIKEVVIPRSVTEIQAGAFQECFDIEKITFQKQNGDTQDPLIIRSGAFAGGTESAYKLKDVYVEMLPSERLLVCEVNAFAFVSLVGQTDVTNEQRATLHFDKNAWSYYAGNWKLGLAFDQSNLNAMKDGYTDTANGYIGGVPNGMAINTGTGYYETGNANTQYAPANGWQQFATTSTGIDVIIPTGDFCRSYSIPDDYYIPTVSGSDIKIARLFRVTGFSDGWTEGQDKTSQALANKAARVATVTEVTDYIPGNTGLIVVGIGTEEGYLIYQKEVEDGVTVKRYTYNADTSDTDNCNLLEPVCDKNNNQPFAINPTDPYPLPAGKNSGYRIFGFMPSSKQFGRPKPNVILAADLAYLKLPVTMFHWSNEGDANSSTGYESNSGAKISLVFDLDEETTGISLRPTISQDDTTADDAWYTLQGVRVERPTAKGIYIHRGKKIMVK